MLLFPLLALVVAQAAAPAAASTTGSAASDDEVAEQIRRFTRVFAAVEANSADAINNDTSFYQGALPAMLRYLDPHSVFLDPGQFDQLRQMEKSEQKGFGSVVSIIPGRVVVLQTLPGTPSAKAGLSPGDEILAVNNIALGQLDFDQMIEVLSQARQRQALIHVRRPGNIRVFPMTLTPELMDSPSVDRVFILQTEATKKKIGHVRISSFDEKTGREFAAALDRLGGASLDGLVLDLRNNPGGVVGAAVEVSSQFLEPGERILTIKGRNKNYQEIDVPKTAKPYKFPVAVLVNAKTASASEIVSGALQDHKRGIILGESTYGKGLVQNVFPIRNETAIVLTTAFYYTPSGRSIQRPLENFQLGGSIDNKKGGIEPDEIVTPEAPSRLREVLEVSLSYTQFATEYIAKHKIDETFNVTPDILDDFRVFLSDRRIQPTLSDWFTDKEKIHKRLRQEIVTVGLGVAKGDEIEVQLDPFVQKAIERISQ
jgi:carboxyl-terminal processing protease